MHPLHVYIHTTKLFDIMIGLVCDSISRGDPDHPRGALVYVVMQPNGAAHSVPCSSPPVLRFPSQTRRRRSDRDPCGDLLRVTAPQSPRAAPKPPPPSCAGRSGQEQGPPPPPSRPSALPAGITLLCSCAMPVVQDFIPVLSSSQPISQEHKRLDYQLFDFSAS